MARPSHFTRPRGAFPPPARPAPRSHDLLLTLFGDYLAGREGPVWTGSLISLLGVMGVSAMAVRTALSRLTRKGWLRAERRGTRSRYALTRRGRSLLDEGARRIFHPRVAAAWDGRWSVVTYGIPETLRSRRDALRVRLAWLGLGPLTSGVWISPHDVEADVRRIAAELRVGRYVEMFRGPHAPPSEAARLVHQCWRLGALNQRYAAFIRRWQGDFERCGSCGLTRARRDIHRPCASPADCFRRRFLLVHEYRAFPRLDPFLPADLLPAVWQGAHAARLFERYHDVLKEPAERYVADVCRQDDTIAETAAL